MKKEIIVLGDIEMGAGTLTDDFISDNALAKLVNSLAKKKHPVDLIFNGDTFDFLKCPVIKDNKRSYPRYITPEISVEKLHLMYQAHKKVFMAIKSFLKTSKKHKVIFIYGNHDYDLIYRWVQSELRNILGYPDQVFFSLNYEQHGVYTEHGHMYDLFYRMNLNNMFLTHQGKKILNMSWMAFGMISKAMKHKEAHPFMDRIQNRHTLLTQNKDFAKLVKWESIKHLLQTIFYYPFRYMSDPTYTLPRDVMKEMFRRLKSLQLELTGIVDIFLQSKKPVLKKNKIIVFGHIHDRYIDERPNNVILQPGSWRDDYEFNQKNGKLIPRTKYYIQIQVKDSGLTWKVIPVIINRKVLEFKKIIKDQKKWLRIVAEQEGYTPRQ
ncbi:hypothetical protein HOC32_04750 [Candidatus Woesearchaeota archaeon]|nr:hypothetical protein [Candidatus Woesearchaeota archaeon]